MFAREFKPKDNIPHYQGIIWFNEELTKLEQAHFRNFNKKKFVRQSKGKGDGSVSFTKAKKIGSLAKYCNDKEGFGLIKTDNITPRMLDKLGKWSDKKKQDEEKFQLKQKFKEMFRQKYTPDYITGNSSQEDRYELWCMMAECAYDCYINSPYNRLHRS